ncbi:hypothetical protein [Rubrivirga marina]|uniref:Outer membrane protein beta-barrel domain-containing protein n=1 Tax=Rubrivirga marina TaxID=1196024 RepID=A0A271IVR8_9BACT|nr:hypothetical protein [Rubrivirga marina]PAP75210.1 hypothetical protein BSZ37_01510 [Rubrivirga marina]
MPRSLLLVLLSLALLAPAASAQVSGVGYRLSPSATYVDFEGDAGLDDGLLYGGGIGLSFGEFVELGGGYQFGDGFQTDFTGFSGLDDAPELAEALAGLDPREVKVERYGGTLRLNLGTAGLVPFLTAGTGLIRFSPDGLEATRNIYLLGGAGLQLTGADRYALAVSVEDLAYRYDPASTFFTAADLSTVGLDFADFNQTTVNNLTVRGTVQLYLGGRRPGQDTEVDRELRRQFSGGLSGLSLFIEPTYGRVRFDEAFDYRDQAFVGGEVGVDLGPLVGLRGFYMRGVEDDSPTSFESVRMLGGDLRLRLSEGGQFVPFVSVGGGYLDVLDGYAADPGAEAGNALAEDRPFATGGAGVELALSPRFRIIGEARALLMSTRDEQDLSQPENVFVSPYYRAGVSFGLGGDAGDGVQAVRRETLESERARLTAEREAVRREALDRIEALEAELAAARAEGDMDAVEVLEAEREVAIDRAVSPDADLAAMPERTAIVDREGNDVQQRILRDGIGAPPSSAVTEEVVVDETGQRTVTRTVREAPAADRMVTIPLPEQGELYVRYGPPGGVLIGDGGMVQGDALTTGDAAVATSGLDEAEVRTIIRESLRESLAAQGDAPLTEGDLGDLERSIENRIADRVAGRLTAPSGASDSRIAALERRQDDLLDEIRALRVELATQPQQPVVVRQPAAPGDDADQDVAVITPTPRPAVPPTRAVLGPSFQISPTAGFGLGAGPDGILVGARVDYATGRSFHYVPELLVTIGGRRSVSANADVAFDVPSGGFADVGSPYVRTGLGLVSYGGSDEIPATFDEEVDDGGTTLTFNLGLGADLEAGGGRLFVDFTTGNLGRFNRLTAGYRFPFGQRAY